MDPPVYIAVFLIMIVAALSSQTAAVVTPYANASYQKIEEILSKSWEEPSVFNQTFNIQTKETDRKTIKLE